MRSIDLCGHGIDFHQELVSCQTGHTDINGIYKIRYEGRIFKIKLFDF